MILILGGTTEGRVAVRVADEAAATYYYSTKGTLQSIECAHGIRLTGAMNAEEMECFCRDHAIKLLIDAAHPFAQVLHQTIEKVSKCLQIPVIRYERRYPPRDEDLIWCDSYADAIHQMENKGIQRLLALSGVNTLAPAPPLLAIAYHLVPYIGAGGIFVVGRKAGLPPRTSGFLSRR